MEQLVVGDVVHIKSGSPKMTIVSIDGEKATVIYFPFGAATHISIPLAALEKKR